MFNERTYSNNNNKCALKRLTKAVRWADNVWLARAAFDGGIYIYFIMSFFLIDVVAVVIFHCSFFVLSFHYFQSLIFNSFSIDIIDIISCMHTLGFCKIQFILIVYLILWYLISCHKKRLIFFLLFYVWNLFQLRMVNIHQLLIINIQHQPLLFNSKFVNRHQIIVTRKTPTQVMWHIHTEQCTTTYIFSTNKKNNQIKSIRNINVPNQTEGKIRKKKYARGDEKNKRRRSRKKSSSWSKYDRNDVAAYIHCWK